MPPLKVAIVCSAHPPGDIRVYSRWVVGLHQAGIDVSLVAPAIPPLPDMPPGVQFIPVEPASGYLKRIRLASRVLKPLRDIAPEIVIYPDPELHPVMLRYRAEADCAVVFDRHENFDRPETLYRGSGPAGRIIASLYPLYEQYVCPRLDGVIVVISSMLDSLPRGTNSIVAHNYPTASVMEALSADPTLADPSFTAVNLGSIQASRGYRQFFELTRMLVRDRGRGDFTLCIGGKWDPGALDWASDYVRQNGLEQNIRLVPARIPHEEVAGIYRGASIGLSPYLDNAKAANQLQNKVAEFMAAGLPVITSASSLNRRIVEEADCGALFWIDELERIADKIEYWMDNPAEAKAIGRRGQIYARENLLWEKELERVLPWLEQLARK